MINLEDIINNNYSIKVSNIEKNNDSTDGNVYMISTCNTKYVVKIYNDLNHTISMVNLHNTLSREKFNVPNIIRNNKNQGYTDLKDSRYIVIYSFLNGKEVREQLDFDCIDTSIKIAKEIRRVHDETMNDDNKYDLEEVPFNVDNSLTRKSLLHFDLTKSNIFYNNEFKGSIGFIDFDDAKWGASVVDLSIAISLLYVSKNKGINLEGIKTFIDVYYGDDIELKNKEIKYIKSLAISWLDYTLNKNVLNRSVTESFEIKKKLIDTKLYFC